MTMPALKPILRTSDETTTRVRRLGAEVSAEFGGIRVTHDRLIAALVNLGDKHWPELIELLRQADSEAE
jgi:hypothetical protein